MLEGKDWSSSVMFSDGENLGMITAGKDVNIAVLYHVVLLFKIWFRKLILSSSLYRKVL